jgi:hypothetical protein
MIHCWSVGRGRKEPAQVLAEPRDRALAEMIAERAIRAMREPAPGS